jgi:hypothetical protein
MHVRILAVAAAAALAVGYLTQSGSQAGGQNMVWKPIVTGPDAMKLIDQAKGIIREEVNRPKKGKVDIRKSNKRIQIQGALIAAYALSAKGGPNQRQLMAAALAGLRLSKAAGSGSPNPEDIKKLAGELDNARGGSRGNGRVDLGNVKWSEYLEDQGDVMQPFKVLPKGGDGIPSALQTSPKVKGKLNGIEEKIRVLANTRPPTMKRNIAKEAAELALLADKVAVIGQLNYYYAPEKKEGKKDPEDWKQWSVEMRDAALKLAEAVRKRNADAVLQASQKLNGSCVRCHNVFKTSD